MSGTALAPNVLLAAKFATIAFLLRDGVAALPDHFVPFVGVFQHAGSPMLFHRILQVTFVIAAVSLLLNRWVRASCLAMGAVVLVGLASSRFYYHNNRLFFALLLVIIGLYDRRVGTRILRYQLVVLYAGAAANKLLLVDWRDGSFVQSWLPHYFSGYSHLASALPDTLLSAVLGWFAMITEVALAVLLLVARFVPIAAWLGVAYHTGLVAITLGNTFGVFWYSAVASYIAVMPWPDPPVQVTVPETFVGRNFARAIGWLDIDRHYRYRCLPGRRVVVEQDGASFTGLAAWTRLVLYLPVAYVIFVIVGSDHTRVIPSLVFIFLGALALGKLLTRRAASVAAA
jgi:hypothetical protein